MAKTLSDELRGRVIAAVEACSSRRAATERFGLGVATAIPWVRMFRATGTVSARTKGIKVELQSSDYARYIRRLFAGRADGHSVHHRCQNSLSITRSPRTA